MTAPDVVVIGGTLSTKEPDQAVVQWLRRVHPATTWTTSVCTGAIYLAAAGILQGQDATTHWAWADELERRGARYTEQRVVETGKVITAVGVSAGIDMALTLLARLYRFTVEGASRDRGVRAVAADHPRSGRAGEQRLTQPTLATHARSTPADDEDVERPADLAERQVPTPDRPCHISRLERRIGVGETPLSACHVAVVESMQCMQ